jgi:hypothetical protein
MDTESAWIENQTRFLDLLCQLTKLGRAEWFQAEYLPGEVHCLVDGEELIRFECRGARAEPVRPTEQLEGVVAHHCNTSYLWLTGTTDWDLLLALLRAARVDEERFRECARIAHRAPVRALEARLGRRVSRPAV